jgi:hypothetical protein
MRVMAWAVASSACSRSAWARKRFSTWRFRLSGLRDRARLARLLIPSPSAHPPGSGESATGQGGAPCRTNDLMGPWRLVCSACPGQMATGWAGSHLSHPTTSTNRQASILEPEVPPEVSKEQASGV